jgi:hypothetical protein
MATTAPVDPAILAGINASQAATTSVSGSSLFNTSSITSSSGGLSGSAFGSYQSQTAASGPTIPLWRETTPFKNNKTSYTAYEPSTPGLTNAPASLFDLPGKGGVPADTGKAAQVTADQASLQFGYILTNPDLLAQWSTLAFNAGLLTSKTANDAVSLGKAWDTAVGWAVNIKAATNGATELTPFEAAATVAQNTGSALIAQQTDAAAHFTGNKITKTTTTDKSNQQSAQDALRLLLGRNPTAGENAAYQHGIQATAAANPTVTTSTNHYTNNVQDGQSNVVTGGYDQNAAYQQAASSASPDVAKEQAATTYYNALRTAIGAAV